MKILKKTQQKGDTAYVKVCSLKNRCTPRFFKDTQSSVMIHAQWGYFLRET